MFFLAFCKQNIVEPWKEWPYGAYCNVSNGVLISNIHPGCYKLLLTQLQCSHLQSGGSFAPGSVYASQGWDLKGSCDGTIAPTSSPIQWTGACEDDPWSLNDLSFYDEGATVRKANRIYECRDWPNSLWCTDAYYEPEKSVYWKNAWVYVGECETFDVASASIEGTLTINAGSRRSLVSVQGLDESETTDLILSAQDAIEDASCTGFPADYICFVDITSLNDESVARRLRASYQRELLPGLFTFGWIAQVTFPTMANWSNAQELASSVSTEVSNRLNAATASNSLVTALVSNALTTTIQNIDFGTASSTTQALQVQTSRSSNTRSSGGSRCKKDSDCASRVCKYGGGSCSWSKKCCEVRTLLYLGSLFLCLLSLLTMSISHASFY